MLTMQIFDVLLVNFVAGFQACFAPRAESFFGAETLLVALFACSLTDITVNKLQSVTYTER